MIQQKVSFRKACKWIFIIYVAVAALKGTQDFLYPVRLLYHNATAPAPMPVLLANGFYFKYKPETPGRTEFHITDESKNEAIASNIVRIMLHNDWVYGYRIGHANEVYYFICKYGEDCSNSQSYKDIEFNQLLKKYGLPEFIKRKAKTYYEFLKEQDKKLSAEREAEDVEQVRSRK